MTAPRCTTSRAFTVAICRRCGPDPHDALLQMLRAAIRRCPHGVLITTECLLGQLTCARRTPQQGAILLLQPCSTDRVPTGTAQWIGPIVDTRDARTASDWVATGAWELGGLPAHLRAGTNFAESGSRN